MSAYSPSVGKQNKGTKAAPQKSNTNTNTLKDQKISYEKENGINLIIEKGEKENKLLKFEKDNESQETFKKAMNQISKKNGTQESKFSNIGISNSKNQQSGSDQKDIKNDMQLSKQNAGQEKLQTQNKIDQQGRRDNENNNTLKSPRDNVLQRTENIEKVGTKDGIATLRTGNPQSKKKANNLKTEVSEISEIGVPVKTISGHGHDIVQALAAPPGKQEKGKKKTEANIPSNTENKMKVMNTTSNENKANEKTQVKSLENKNTEQFNKTYQESVTNYSEVPAYSKYHEKRLNSKKAEMEKLAVQQVDQEIEKKAIKEKEEVPQKQIPEKPKSGNTSSKAPIKSNVPAQPTKRISLSPDLLFEKKERALSPTSFEERNKAWMMKRSERIAEKEKKKILRQSSNCTFQPSMSINSIKRVASPEEFYKRNIEWRDKVKAENINKVRHETEKVLKTESSQSSRPRLKPASIPVLKGLKPFGLNIDNARVNTETDDISTNRKLGAFFEYEWNNEKLNQEIQDIEELYGATRALIKAKLDLNSASMTQRTNLAIETERTDISSRRRSPVGMLGMPCLTEGSPIKTNRENFTHRKKDSIKTVEKPKSMKKETLSGPTFDPNIQNLVNNSNSFHLIIQNNRYVIMKNKSSE